MFCTLFSETVKGRSENKPKALVITHLLLANFWMNHTPRHWWKSDKVPFEKNWWGKIAKKGREKVLIKQSPEWKLFSSSLAYIPDGITKHYVIMSFYAFYPTSSGGFIYLHFRILICLSWERKYVERGDELFSWMVCVISKLDRKGPSIIKLANYQCLGRLHFHWYNKEMGGLDFGF